MRCFSSILCISMQHLLKIALMSSLFLVFASDGLALTDVEYSKYMYLTSKTTVIDEDIKEELVAHSRGRVNAYEVLSEKKGSDGCMTKNVLTRLLLSSTRTIPERFFFPLNLY
jgi:hypothetical protein